MARTAEKTRYVAPDPAAVSAIYNAAVKAGTHGPPENFQTVCGSCRNWVGGIWFVNEQGTRLCKTCAPPDRK